VAKRLNVATFANGKKRYYKQYPHMLLKAPDLLISNCYLLSVAPIADRRVLVAGFARHSNSGGGVFVAC
jgi:hypothetical protein